MIPPLSIQEQLSRWDAEKSRAGRDDQIDTDEDRDDEEEELPMVGAPSNSHVVHRLLCAFIFILLLAADHTDL